MSRDIAIEGCGWAFPPTFERGRNAVLLSSAERNIEQCLWVLLSTSIGERVMLWGYGTDLSRRVFDAMSTTMANDIRTSLFNAILSWEPRIDVIDITVSQEALDGRVLIALSYLVRRTNARNNLVYPFYLNEATLAPPAP